MMPYCRVDNWQPSTAQRNARDTVARAMGIEPHLVVSRSRKVPIVRARQAAVWVIRRRWPNLGWHQVARVVNMDDHSSAIHADRRAEEWRLRDTAFREATDAILAGLPVIVPAKLVIPEPPPKPPKPRVVDTSELIDARSGRWCAQCDALVGAERQAACRSRWCSLKASA